MYKGKQFGDDLTDNAHVKDGYGYHDVIHLAFAAVLGWSPLVRKMLKVKRKSDPKVDQVEDGGRAIATEEGLSAMIFAYARDYNFFEGKSSVSTELLRMIKNMVRHLEVSACTPGEWEQAIVEGFRVWREVKKRRGGTVDVDLDKRCISLRETLNGGTMRIIGHGIDVVKIAGIKEELDSTNKRWAEQFCSADEREQAGTTPDPLPLLRELIRRQGSRGQGAGDGLRGRHHLARHRDPAAGQRSTVHPTPRRGAGAGDQHGDNRLVHQHQLSDEIAMASVIAVGD